MQAPVRAGTVAQSTWAGLRTRHTCQQPLKACCKTAAHRQHQHAGRCSATAAGQEASSSPAASGEAEITSQAEAAGPLVQQLNAEELEIAISDRDRPLIIDFFATWCGPCLLLAKELEKVAAELGDSIRIVKVDTDANPMLSSQLQIQGLPTMVFVSLDKEKPALRTEGLLPAEVIKEIIEKEL
ncbi:hypothetical protein WJX74_002219 [Apatococcus lobatus]|uniref:Thioredoxin domain-containing protein n=1 Tax=Apatococcus lobatus TaxID=904363 RepID=A0AAW1RSG0_9CHLO